MKLYLFSLLFIFYFYPANSQTSTVISNTSADSLINSILSGDDDISLILKLYEHNKNISEDSLIKWLSYSNQNYLRNDSNRKSDPDFQLRYIYFSDQYYRLKCYRHQQISYDVVESNDSLLQTIFLETISKYNSFDILNNTLYQNTFQLLLIHSVSTKTDFFEKNFHIFSAALSNNFKEYNTLQFMMDLYLKFKFNKQYFNTGYGMGKLSDGTFGLLPQLPESELNDIFTILKIESAIY